MVASHTRQRYMFFSPSLRNLSKVEERLGGDVNKTRRDAAFVKVVTGMPGVGFDSLKTDMKRIKPKKNILEVYIGQLY